MVNAESSVAGGSGPEDRPVPWDWHSESKRAHHLASAYHFCASKCANVCGLLTSSTFTS